MTVGVLFPYGLRVMNIKTDDIQCIIRFPFGKAQPIRCGDFFYVKEFDGHIYKGKAFSLEEHNKIAQEVVKQYQDYSPPLQAYSEFVIPAKASCNNMQAARAALAMKREEKKAKEAKKGNISDSIRSSG